MTLIISRVVDLYNIIIVHAQMLRNKVPTPSYILFTPATLFHRISAKYNILLHFTAIKSVKKKKKRANIIKPLDSRFG